MVEGARWCVVARRIEMHNMILDFDENSCSHYIAYDREILTEFCQNSYSYNSGYYLESGVEYSHLRV